MLRLFMAGERMRERESVAEQLIIWTNSPIEWFILPKKHHNWQLFFLTIIMSADENRIYGTQQKVKIMRGLRVRNFSMKTTLMRTGSNVGIECGTIDLLLLQFTCGCCFNDFFAKIRRSDALQNQMKGRERECQSDMKIQIRLALMDGIGIIKIVPASDMIIISWWSWRLKKIIIIIIKKVRIIIIKGVSPWSESIKESPPPPFLLL